MKTYSDVSPPHYDMGEMPITRCIASVAVGYSGSDAFYVGNIIKYLARAPYKGDTITDLCKAMAYLEFLIGSAEEANHDSD